MNEIIIELKNVSKKLGADQIFEKINLQLENGKIYGFIGRNGTGKSVLFKLISGYMKADEGCIIVNGLELGKKQDFPDQLGLLIERPGFMWFESAYQNLDYLASINQKIEKEEIENWIEKVGLDPKSRKPVGKYSLGMKQRLGIAQAMMEEPNILILDEPMNGLDEEGIERIRKLLAEYKRTDRVILLASHNKEDIELLCDEVYKLAGGKIEKIDKFEE